MEDGWEAEASGQIGRLESLLLLKETVSFSVQKLISIFKNFYSKEIFVIFFFRESLAAFF